MTESTEPPVFSTLSVLVPVYNESKTVAVIVEQVLASPVSLALEIVMVDDGSSDDSWELMQALASNDERIRVHRHPVNRGKGAAIRTAIELMTGDLAIVQDADLEYDPQEFPRVIGPILEGRADAVFGSRFASSPVRRVLFYWHSLGNKFLTWLFNIFNDLNLTDMETCYKAVRADVLRELRLESERFGIEPEIATRLAQWGARIYEVPISYHGRTYAEGKHIGWRDGVQALWLIVKYRFIDIEYTRTGEGSATSLGAARAYAKWVLDASQITPDTSITEIDPGVGNYSRLLLGATRLTLVEANPRLAAALERRFARSPHVSVVAGRGGVPADHAGSSEVVFSANGLSLAPSAEEWLRSAHDALAPGGRLSLLVPAHDEFTRAIDASIAGRRRFEPEELRTLLIGAGFEQVEIQEFNKLGAWAWRLAGLAGVSGIARWQAIAYSWVVPLARWLDTVLPGRGLSLIVGARRPSLP